MNIYFKSKEEGEGEGEGLTILSGFFTYLIDYSAYFFLTFVDPFCQEIFQISIIEIWPSLGAISAWIIFFEVIIGLILLIKLLSY